MTTLFTGTSGFAYKEWKGSFYPESLADSEMLAYYAGRLPAVEINNTFYRLPKRSVLEAWRDSVPDGFRFVLKASRRITHMKRLKDAGEPTTYLIDASAALGGARGPILYQLPPYLKKDVPRLVDFLALLGDEPGAAFEFRHESWHDDDVFAALADAGAALCIADAGAEADAPVVATTPRFGYARLRRGEYGDDELAGWAERLAAQGWTELYCFFKHEDAGAGPRLAERFRGLFAGAAGTAG